MSLIYNYSRLLKVFTILLCFMMFVTPIINVLAQTKTMNQEPSYAEIQAQAEADAREDESGVGYGIGGFFCGIFGWLFAQLSSPDVPATRLIGKSANYVAIYAEAYKRKAKSVRTTAACIGWAIGSTVSLIIILSDPNKTSN